MKQIKTVLAVFLVLSVVLVTGCSSNTDNKEQAGQQNGQITANDQTKPEKAAPDKKAAKNIKMTVYFPDENGQKLIAAERTLDISTDDKYTAAIKALLQGPKKGEGIAIIPAGTKLLGVTVNKDGLAEVNFDNTFVKKFSGGSTGEIMLVGSITDTLTNLSEVKTVRFLVDGKPSETLSGHLDLTTPVTRMQNIL